MLSSINSIRLRLLAQWAPQRMAEAWMLHHVAQQSARSHSHALSRWFCNPPCSSLFFSIQETWPPLSGEWRDWIQTRKDWELGFAIFNHQVITSYQPWIAAMAVIFWSRHVKLAMPGRESGLEVRSLFHQWDGWGVPSENWRIQGG